VSQTSSELESPPPSSPAPAPAAPPKARPSALFLVALSVLSLAGDLGSKWWVVEHLDSPTYAGRMPVLGDAVSFVSARNPGGAWGILGDEHASIRIPFFVAISVVAVVFILSLYRKLAPDQWALKWGLPLVLGGALGNLVDRIRYGHVVDFIAVRVTSSFTWPTFNIADVAIVVGVALMAVDMFTPRPKAPKVSAAQPSEPAAE
jgi:signal peptidase II